jgi:hypothetical protein
MTLPSTPEDSPRITDVDYFDPDNTLITTLKRAIAHEQDILLQRDGGGELVLLGSRNEYFSAVSDEQFFYTAPVAGAKLTLLSRKDPRIPPVESIGREVDELLWKAAFYNSRGRLMHGYYPVDVVELAAWPNLTRLPHTTNAPRIASLLSRQPTSIAVAGRLLKVSPEEMYQFYSAARCAGLARPINRTPQEPRLAPHRHQTLLLALWKRIAGI